MRRETDDSLRLVALDGLTWLALHRGANSHAHVAGPACSRVVHCTIYRAALYFAARNGHARAVEELVRLGAEPDVVDEQENTPLHVAAELGNLGTVLCVVGRPPCLPPPH